MPDETPAATEKPKKERPLITSFTIVQRNEVFFAIAIQSRGDRVLQEKVLESDDDLRIPADAVDVAMRRLGKTGLSPFDAPDTAAEAGWIVS